MAMRTVRLRRVSLFLTPSPTVCPRTRLASARSLSSSVGGPARRGPSLPLAGVLTIALGLSLGSASRMIFSDRTGKEKLEPYKYANLPIVSSEEYTPSTSVGLSSVPSTSPGEQKGDGQHRLIQIALPAGGVDSSIPPDPLRIHSIYVKEPSLQIERAYTPLTSPLPTSNLAESAGHSLELLVKRYQDGEVSRYLHRLAPGASTEVRGPVCTWAWDERGAGIENQAKRMAAGREGPTTKEERQKQEAALWPDEVVMIVGGTGITPAYQLLTSCFGMPPSVEKSSSPSSPGRQSTLPPPAASAPSSSAPSASRPLPRFTLLYGAPSPSSLLLRNELDALARQHPDHLRIGYWIEHVGSGTGAGGELGGAPNSQTTSWTRWLPSFSLRAEPQVADQTGPPSVQQGLIGSKDVKRWLGPPAVQSGDSQGRRVILVCGPDHMTAALAGPRARDGRGQGPIAGVLGTLGYGLDPLGKEEVVKL